MSSGGVNVLLPVTGTGMAFSTLLLEGYPIYAVFAALIVALSVVTFLRVTNRKQKNA